MRGLLYVDVHAFVFGPENTHKLFDFADLAVLDLLFIGPEQETELRIHLNHPVVDDGGHFVLILLSRSALRVEYRMWSHCEGSLSSSMM